MDVSTNSEEIPQAASSSGFDDIIIDVDMEAPTVGSAAIKISNVKVDGFTISWEKAKDNQTEQKDILYQVYLKNLSDSKGKWTKVVEFLDRNTYTFTQLEANTKYAFFIKALDLENNELTYPAENHAMAASTSRVIVEKPESTLSRPESEAGTFTRPSNNNSRNNGSTSTFTRPSSTTGSSSSSENSSSSQSGSGTPAHSSARVDAPAGKRQYMDQSEPESSSSSSSSGTARTSGSPGRRR